MPEKTSGTRPNTKKTQNKISQNTRTYLIISAAMVFLTVFIYLNFQNYRPKSLKQLKDVKTIDGEESFILPYPQESTKVSTDQTATSQQTTFQTKKSVIEVRDFYKNALLNKGWELESEAEDNGSIHLDFKSEDTDISVSAFKQAEGADSLVTIDVVEK